MPYKKTKNNLDWEKVARLFHNTYEEQAPFFGYITRKETRKFNPKSQNGKLMTKVCEIVVSTLLKAQRTEILGEIKLLIKDSILAIDFSEKKEPNGYSESWNSGYNKAYRQIKGDLETLKSKLK